MDTQPPIGPEAATGQPDIIDLPAASPSSSPRPNLFAPILGLAVVAILVVAALSASPTSDDEPVDDLQSAAVAGARFETVDGQRVELAELEGSPVALLFLTPGCPSCVEEAMAWQDLVASYPELRVFAVDVDPFNPPEQLAAYRDSFALGDLEWVVDAGDPSLQRTFEVAAMDTTIVIDASGTIVFRDAETTSPTTLQAVLQELRP